MRCTTETADKIARLLEGAEGTAARIATLHRHVDQRIVRGRGSLDYVRALRYDAFRREGATEARSDRRLGDRFDHSPNAAVFAIRFEDRLCATIRLRVVESVADESPAVHVFADHLVPLIERGERLVEPNSFCVDPLLAGRFPEFAYLALRLPFMAAGLRSCSSVTATVRAEHAAFYRRVLRCHPVALPRPYPGRTTPLGLMLVSYDAESAAVEAQRPFFAAVPGEAEKIGLDRFAPRPEPAIAA